MNYCSLAIPCVKCGNINQNTKLYRLDFIVTGLAGKICLGCVGLDLLNLKKINKKKFSLLEVTGGVISS